MENKPLIKALTEAGTGSRRRLADAIKQGKVTINGETVESFNHPVNPDKDTVTVDGQEIDLKPTETVCLMLNKPKGYLSTVRDERGRRTVIELLPEKYRHLRLYPAGRLDGDSTGLMLLTNDGDLTYRLTHPKFEHEKEYLVQVKGRLTESERQELERGIRLEDGVTHPAVVKTVTVSPPFNYSITIHEGRKRQVRRMFERVKHPVIELKRVRIGGLTLGNLKEGKVKKLNRNEINALSGD
ncbi:MAG: pseudouridine synthase [Dehalococcoidia bacterium]|jgi:23S rRNA pseudouridine2605 synthase